MKGRHWQRLATKDLLPQFPELGCKGRLLFVTPIGQLLRGLLLESSGFRSDGGYLEAFAQPLFIPTDHFWYSVSEREGGPSHYWEIDLNDPQPSMHRLSSAIAAEGMGFLESVRDLVSYASKLQRSMLIDGRLLNPHVAEPLAYSLILLGDLSGSAKTLSLIQDSLKTDAVAAPWTQELGIRIGQIEEAQRSDPALAIELLNTWRIHTVTNLGLTERAGLGPA
jgi:hypothetical protein